MNWKNIAKILGISVAVIVLVLAGLLIWGLSKLPSAFEIKQSLTPPALKERPHSESSPQPEAETSSQTSDAEGLPEKSADQSKLNKDEVLRQQSLKVIQEDFMDERKPLADACRTMGKASESGFLKDPKNASARYFFSTLAEENKDPLSEAAAPAMRMIFRAPGMNGLMDMILKADEAQDPGVLKKAEFYYEIYRAGSYLKTHLAELNTTLQQSYNLYHVMKAVALKPELANSPQVMTFCEDLQKNLNTQSDFNVEEGAKEMQNFLEQNGIKPAEVGFDPKYRSKVDLTVSNTQLGVNDAWIAQIFAEDLKKAMKDREQK
ncbi:hypothetical protein AZI86_13385 [Bdellovibrio bacteriovorus]|uniref:Uncharacterized protein n=1 Tax=Bdellovibrio bacteriovorus TaxID=959 RepID=A0A150WJ77_BDEBC|nr:hypothetical protein [Bdellovibrio bacteriovorus]KYG63809.1 hypothetical protein AZI86_13385 [Bdellovibrio bacteriovorus]